MAELFDFDKGEIIRHIEHELRTFEKFQEPFNYVINTLKRLGHSYAVETLDDIDANKIIEKKGKSYNYSVIEHKNISIIIRRYGKHLTIYTKKKAENSYKNEYGAFTFDVDLKKFGDKSDEMSEKYCEKPFTGLNEILPGLLTLLLGSGVYWVDNSISLPRPDYITIKLAFSNKNILSLDDFIFCMEELSSIYLNLFSETTMLSKIQQMTNEIGLMLTPRFQIGSISTTIEDNYFHAAGITLIDITNNSKQYEDVYSLSHWYINEIFKENFLLYNGDVYVPGGEFIEGEPIAYKVSDDVTLYEKGFLEQHFYPLKKFKHTI